MKSIISLLTAVVIAGAAYLMGMASMQWNVMWGLAPALAGMCGYNLWTQMDWAETQWERACSFIAMFLICLTGWALGVFACAAYADIGYLTNEVLVIGGLVSFGLMVVGFILAWVTMPATEYVEETETTVPVA